MKSATTWIALGWEGAHENQTDPYKQEVKVERGVATNEWRKRADYAFLATNFRLSATVFVCNVTFQGAEVAAAQEMHRP